MIVQSRVTVCSVLIVLFLGECRPATGWDYPGVGCKDCTTRTWHQPPTATATSSYSENRTAGLNSTEETSQPTTLKFWDPDQNLTTPLSLRKNYGTEMGELEDTPRETDAIKASDKEEEVENEKKIQNSKSKKNKLKTTTLADSSAENEEKSTVQTKILEKNKLEPRSQISVERLIRKKDGSSVEKKINRDPYTDSEPDKKHNFWEESDFEPKVKSRTRRIYDAERNRFETERGSFKDSTEKKIKYKPERYSSTEKRHRDRLASTGIYTKRYYSDEKFPKHRPGSDSSVEKKYTKYEDDSDKNEYYTTTKRTKIIRTRPEIYSDTGRNKRKPDSDSSPEYKPKPNSMDGSPENKNNLGEGDSDVEQNIKKNWASDLSQEKKLRKPVSSVSSEEPTKPPTRKPSKRWKVRNQGKEKYLYKRKKVLRSTLLPQAYQEQKLADNGEYGNDEEDGAPHRDIMDPYIDPFLNPYACKADMEKVASKLPGVDSVQTEVVGRTAEYNDIVMLKLSGSKTSMRFRADANDDKYLDEPPEKKIVFIVHGLSVYGMVNLACLSKMRMLKTLMAYYAKHLDKFDIYFIPIANPDGFTYSQQVRLWSKNRSPQSICQGVHVDRNFEVFWNDNVKINSCDQHYPGPAPFSEAESRAIREIFHKHAHRMIAYIHVHAGCEDESIFKGDAVLYPKGYTESNEDIDRYLDMQGEIEEMMRNASFRHMTVQVTTLKEWYGKVRGTSVDYASSVYGIPYAMEFAMQPYPDNRFFDFKPNYEKLALEQIWQRVIDVVFHNINNNHQDQVGFKLKK